MEKNTCAIVHTSSNFYRKVAIGLRTKLTCCNPITDLFIRELP